MGTRRVLFLHLFLLINYILFIIGKPLLQVDRKAKMNNEIQPLKEICEKLFDSKTSSNEKPGLRTQLSVALETLGSKVVKVKDDLIEKVHAQLEYGDLKRRLEKLEVALLFRYYVYGIRASLPPPNAEVPPKCMAHQIHYKEELQNKFDWLTILTEEKYSENIFISRIKNAVREEFIRRENLRLDIELKELNDDEMNKYLKFLELFCEGIAAGIRRVDGIINYQNFGRYPREELLKLFADSCDEYMTIFYRAVVVPGKSIVVDD